MSFAELYEEYKLKERTYFNTLDELQAGFDAALIAAYKAAFPKKRYQPGKAVDMPTYPEIRAEWVGKAEALRSEYRTEADRLHVLLKAAALVEQFPRLDDLQIVATVNANEYRSQGYGCSKYTEAAAEQIADKARLHGLRVEVRPLGGPHTSRDSIVYQDYGVYVDTTDVGWAMLGYRPNVELREWIRMCWKRGVNPRVYQPLLSHGLEEKLGLDFFGGETTPTA